MSADAPVPAMQPPPSNALLNTLFGHELRKFNIPILKSLLSAFGIRGLSHGRRQQLIDRVQVLETDCTDAQRNTVQWLLENGKGISQITIAAGIVPADQVPAEAVASMLGSAQELLYNVPKECDICAETKEFTEFPEGKLIPECNHVSTICTECWITDINTQIESKQWNLVRCMICPAVLPTNTVKSYTTPELFERYNDFMVSWHMKDIRNFRWCHNQDCGSGQVYPNAMQRRVVCFKCGHANCFSCRTVWHEGKSCKASTKARLAMLGPDEQTQVLIATTTNVCPACNAQVEKAGGCPHMTCRCGNHFIWLPPATIADHLPPIPSSSK